MADSGAIQLGFIGGGVMAEAILARLCDRGTIAPAQILVSEPMAARRSLLVERYGVQTTDDNRSLLAQAAVVVLAIKPQMFATVAAQVAGAWNAAQPPLVLSILAGTPLAKLEAAFGGCPVVRAMPNTPATVGAGVTAIAPGSRVTADHMAQARQIFEAIGSVVEVPESLMDAVTGLSGSGPAFVALFVEALTDGGVAAGLPRATASTLALQTVLGTAQLLLETELHPAVLKDRVTSPGGTTIAGVAALERAGLRSAVIEAVQAAWQRSRSLGQD